MPVTPNFADRLKAITNRNRKKTHAPGTTWPLEKKMEVVGMWLALGNMKEVSVATGVDYDLIRKWKGQPWWQELEAEFRLTENLSLDNKISAIVTKSLDAVVDRLENGDYIYDQKSGSVARRPAALRDVHRVSVDMLSKREQLRKEEREDTSTTLSVEEQLKLLAIEMAKWNKKQTDSERTIDLVEVEDAVYVDEHDHDDSEGISTLDETSGLVSTEEEADAPDLDDQGASGIA